MSSMGIPFSGLDRFISGNTNKKGEKMDMVNLAYYFASAAHAAVGQKRKYSGKDYIVHPVSVSRLVYNYGGNDVQIAAAYLHDVVEDTNVSIDDIFSLFGNDIGDAVSGLTDVSVASDGNRKTRKEIDRQHSANANYDAQFVKCADIIDNSADIGANDPNFARVYKKEMIALLVVLDKVKDTDIYLAAVDSVNKM